MPTQHFLGFTICLSRMFFPVLSSQSYRLGISRFGDVSHDRFLRKKGCTVGRINIHTALDDLSLEFSVKFLPAKKLKKKFFFRRDRICTIFDIKQATPYMVSGVFFIFVFFFISPLSRYRSDKNRSRRGFPAWSIFRMGIPGSKSQFFFPESDRLGFCGCNDVL